jgi:hypothetical protein
MVNKRQVEYARSMIGAISKPKEAKTMAKKATAVVKAENVTKAKADFKAQAQARSRKSQQERVGFVQEFGKALSAAWAKLGDKANVMAVAKTMPKEKVRLIHYALVSLGLLETKDGGLLAWVKADRMVTTAASEPKKRIKAIKAPKDNHEASTSA